MVTFRPDGSGDCSFYKCAQCIPTSTGNGGELSVFFCGTDCGNPPTPANGAVTLTNYGETTPGATATQMCDIGYTLSGTADIYCGTDGLWSDHPVTCSLIDCREPPTPISGMIRQTPVGITTYGATATQTCNVGYEPNGTAVISCGSDGSWSDVPVTCTLKDCGPPTVSDNVTVVLTDAGITTYGASASQSCDVGFDLSGVANITCKADGNWSDPVITCIIKDCGLPTNPANGTVKLTDAGTTTYGATATQSCNIGFNLTGVANITCGADGNWSDAAVTCTIKDCGLPTTTDNGTVVLSDAGITTYGASATHSCNVGYELNGVKTITCGDDGNWSKPAVTCTVKDCGPPIVPDNGTVELTDDGVTTHDASATQSCQIGYNLSGVVNITCGADGNWSDPAVTCTIKDCGYPGSPGNGTVTLIGDGLTTFGSIATQTCDTGYDLTGDTDITCGAGGLWSHTVVTCTIKDCDSPTSPVNGSVLLADPGITTYGALATQRCDIGYDLSGVVNITCTADGNWSHLAVICTIKDCNDPLSPTNGYTTLNTAGLTTYEANATLSCNRGYTLSGNETMVCKADGLWSLHAKCIIKDCKVPEQPSNGILKLAVDGVTTFGAKASVSCNAGYELVGDVYVRCRADGVWSSLPSCNFKGYIAALAAVGGFLFVGLSAVAGYWFISRIFIKPSMSVSAVMGGKLDEKGQEERMDNTDGYTPDVKW